MTLRAAKSGINGCSRLLSRPMSSSSSGRGTIELTACAGRVATGVALNRPHFVRPVYWEEPLPEQAGLPPVSSDASIFSVSIRSSAPSPSPSALPSPAGSESHWSSPTLETPPEVRRAPISRLVSYGSAAAVLIAAVGLSSPC